MRLLNTATYELSEFFEDKIPPYVILSHTWGDDEVLYQHMKETAFQNRKGWQKIQKACSMARSYDFTWIWIDTCCIDKSSSAELSEAINSMFNWYAEADVCYAYLADVDCFAPYRGSVREFLYTSRWFTRGWTLQELIAPTDLTFYDVNWHDIGTKTSMSGLLSGITRIDRPVLLDNREYLNRCVAERMSWAACRRTTRQEDVAYSLLGLFNVNMPLLYGERDRAFHRLQLEILRTTRDHSIFAWTSAADDSSDTRVLAPGPQAFYKSGRSSVDRSSCRSLMRKRLGQTSPLGECEMTNVGLRIDLMLSARILPPSLQGTPQDIQTRCNPAEPPTTSIQRLALLECLTDDRDQIFCCIVVQQQNSKDNIWTRVFHHVEYTCQLLGEDKVLVSVDRVESRWRRSGIVLFVTKFMPSTILIQDSSLPRLRSKPECSGRSFIHFPDRICVEQAYLNTIPGQLKFLQSVSWMQKGRIELPELRLTKSPDHMLFLFQHHCPDSEVSHSSRILLFIPDMSHAVTSNDPSHQPKPHEEVYLQEIPNNTVISSANFNPSRAKGWWTEGNGVPTPPLSIRCGCRIAIKYRKLGGKPKDIESQDHCFDLLLWTRRGRRWEAVRDDERIGSSRSVDVPLQPSYFSPDLPNRWLSLLGKKSGEEQTSWEPLRMRPLQISQDDGGFRVDF